MYTRFNGENGQSPARWLRTIKYELPPTLTAGQWLECVDGLLDGKAACWADEWREVKAILSDEYLKHAKDDGVETFKKLLINRFTPVYEGMEGVHHLFITLRQNATESLEDYYRRAEDLLHASGSILGDRLMGMVIRQYVSGLYHSCLQSNSAFQSDSLLQAYKTTRRDERQMLEMGEEEYVKMKNDKKFSEFLKRNYQEYKNEDTPR